jgi:catechol 2,3-dioxygenase-like lactoylglutathione lyase family enzyme
LLPVPGRSPTSLAPTACGPNQHPTALPVAARLAGGGDFKDASAGKPDCYRWRVCSDCPDIQRIGNELRLADGQDDDGQCLFFVPDIEAACARFESLGAPFVKRLDTGMQHVAFISDPDQYWIEIVQADVLGNLGQ